MATNTLSTPAGAIRMLDPRHEIILLRDFNLHYPLWSAIQRHAGYRPSAQELLTIIEDFHLQLLTVPGTPTHRWKDGESTIDLTFASEEVASRIIHYKIDKSLDCDSDQLPIALAIDWSWRAATLTRKRLWTKTNVALLRQTVKERLSRSCDVTELLEIGRAHV